MEGQVIKAMLSKMGYSQTKIAELIGESKQNFNSFLRSDDIKSSLVERIAQATGVPVSALYGESQAAQTASAIGTCNTAVAGNGNSVNEGKLIDLLKEKDVQMARSQDQIDRLLGLLEKK